MNKFVLIIFSFLITFFISGCTQKVIIKALEPAEIDRVTVTKKIAVLKFKNDRLGLASKIETNLARFKIQNKSFFTLVNRRDINQIIQEQKIQNSGLVNTDDIVEVGSLIGAQALISGRVYKPSLQDTYYYETRAKCADKKCKEMYYYDVRCTQRVIALSADIKIADITKGDIIYADSISKSSKYTHCSDDDKHLPSKNRVAKNLATRIASSFTYKLTPHYKNFEVELLEDPDLDYDDAQEQLLKSSLKYIKHNRFSKAEQLLRQLVDSTSQQSYVAFYNLGVVTESQGNYEKALSYYEKADNLAIEPVEVIDYAYVRINSIIEKHKITKEQMSR